MGWGGEGGGVGRGVPVKERGRKEKKKESKRRITTFCESCIRRRRFSQFFLSFTFAQYLPVK